MTNRLHNIYTKSFKILCHYVLRVRITVESMKDLDFLGMKKEINLLCIMMVVIQYQNSSVRCLRFISILMMSKKEGQHDFIQTNGNLTKIVTD